jgi:uncharacterized protein (DUF302 family)
MSSSATSDLGVLRIASSHSVAETMARLEALLRERGVLIFARIDFSGDAGAAPQAWMRFMAGSYSGRAETTAG